MCLEYGQTYKNNIDLVGVGFLAKGVSQLNVSRKSSKWWKLNGFVRDCPSDVFLVQDVLRVVRFFHMLLSLQ